MLSPSIIYGPTRPPFARRCNNPRYIGGFIDVEYYENLSRVGNDQLYAVTDFKPGECDVELGIGYGRTPQSGPLVTKAIIGYAFPAPGKSNADEAQTISMTNPLVRRSSAERAWAPVMSAR